MSQNALIRVGDAHTVTREDYKLLETMNKLSKDKYSDMSTQAESLNVVMARLHEKCTVLRCPRGPLAHPVCSLSLRCGACCGAGWRQTRRSRRT